MFSWKKVAVLTALAVAVTGGALALPALGDSLSSSAPTVHIKKHTAASTSSTTKHRHLKHRKHHHTAASTKHKAA